MLVSGIFPFVRKQYKAFSIHFETNLPITLHQLYVDKYKQAGSGWKRFVGRDGGMKQKKKKSRGKGEGKHLIFLGLRIYLLPHGQ